MQILATSWYMSPAVKFLHGGSNPRRGTTTRRVHLLFQCTLHSAVSSGNCLARLFLSSSSTYSRSMSSARLTFYHRTVSHHKTSLFLWGMRMLLCFLFFIFGLHSLCQGLQIDHENWTIRPQYSCPFFLCQFLQLTTASRFPTQRTDNCRKPFQFSCSACTTSTVSGCGTISACSSSSSAFQTSIIAKPGLLPRPLPLARPVLIPPLGCCCCL